MLLWIILIGGLLAVSLAFFAMRGPSASKSLKRRIELVKERHGDVIVGSAQAQIRKLFAQRANRVESYVSTLIPKPALLRKRLEMTGKDISLGKYAMICLGTALAIATLLMLRGAPMLLSALLIGAKGSFAEGDLFGAAIHGTFSAILLVVLALAIAARVRLRGEIRAEARPQVGADALVFDGEGRVLVITRKNPPCRGQRAFPGTLVLGRESPEEA